MEKKVFDILVMGGGHAGLEAAAISARLGCRVALLTMPGVPLGSTPCNPSIGGVGKAQVVREIDFLGGLMGKLADQGAIHYKTLNDSKGYAVRSTRVQIDKTMYQEAVKRELAQINSLEIIRKKVEKIEKKAELFEVITEKEKFFGKKCIITAGTFLGGKLHIGSHQKQGGRIHTHSSKAMTSLFDKIETLPVRFKTGTPPRIAKDSINFDNLQEQPSDPYTKTFHWKESSQERKLPQRSCFITYTNEKTLKIIRAHKEDSPLFNGQIKGIGPRYCPSIEDKAYRYLDRNKHHIFLEPEGLEEETIYPSGLSTSLPLEVQEKFLKTISGLEECRVLIPGYAVEYDVVNTEKLTLGLEYRDIPGLYFAGQVNGTSGYEEAAAQGLMAGINGSRSLQGKKALVLSRTESYIGVLVNDLVGCQRDEPYRLFTARNENKLYVREDNTFLRMLPYRKELGLNGELDQYLESLKKEHKVLKSLVSHYVFKEKTEGAYFQDKNLGGFQGGGLSLENVIKSSQGKAIEVLKGILTHWGLCFKDEVVETVAIGEVYRGYIHRSNRELRHERTLNEASLNMDFLLNSHNISFECKERIRKRCPENFGQLKKIPGIRPATLAYVSSRL